MSSPSRLLLVIATSLLIAAGCGDDESGSGGGGTGGGDGGAGGDGGSAAEPLTGADNTWTFIPVDGMHCGNGSDTGVGFNPAAGSDKLLIFFQGGGACYSKDGCLGPDPAAANFTGFGETEFAKFSSGNGTEGVFDRSDPNNPFADYNIVFFPYCTGDVHTGNNIVGELNFVGNVNVKAALPRILATYPTPSSYFVAGQSAGGYGAIFNFDVFATAYGPSIPGHFVDDSAPPFPVAGVAALGAVIGVWGLSKTAPEGCPECIDLTTPGGGLHNFIPYYANTYPNARGSLISSYEDDVIGPILMLDPATYTTLLNDLADDTVPLNPNFRVYYLEGSRHVWTNGGDMSHLLEDVVSDGVALSTFLQQQVDGDAAWANVRP